MGMVYLCRDLALDERVALKLFGRPGEATRPEDAWWFQEEARALAGVEDGLAAERRDVAFMPPRGPCARGRAEDTGSNHEVSSRWRRTVLARHGPWRGEADQPAEHPALRLGPKAPGSSEPARRVTRNPVGGPQRR